MVRFSLDGQTKTAYQNSPYSSSELTNKASANFLSISLRKQAKVEGSNLSDPRNPSLAA